MPTCWGGTGTGWAVWLTYVPKQVCWSPEQSSHSFQLSLSGWHLSSLVALKVSESIDLRSQFPPRLSPIHVSSANAISPSAEATSHCLPTCYRVLLCTLIDSHANMMISLKGACLVQSLSCNEVITGTGTSHSLRIPAKHTPDFPQNCWRLGCPGAECRLADVTPAPQQPPWDVSITAGLAGSSWNSPPQTGLRLPATLPYKSYFYGQCWQKNRKKIGVHEMPPLVQPFLAYWKWGNIENSQNVHSGSLRFPRGPCGGGSMKPSFS